MRRIKGRWLIGSVGILSLLLGLLILNIKCGNSGCFASARGKSGELIQFSGRVTYVNFESGFFYLQNGRSAMRVEASDVPLDIALGQELTVVGSLDEEPGSDVIRFARIQTKKAACVPKAISINAGNLLDARYENWRVELAGIVRSAVFANYGQLRLRLFTGQKEIEVRIQELRNVDPKSIVGSAIRVRGVLKAGLDADGNRSRLLILAQSTDDLIFARRAQQPVHKTLPDLPLLTKAIQVHSLTPEQASREYPVRLQATITFYDSAYQALFLHDGSGGVYVTVRGLANRGFRVGERIEVKGYSIPGEFAAILNAEEVRILGRSALPNHPAKDVYEIFAGRQDSNWVEIKGIVRSLGSDKGRATMQLNWAGKQFEAVVADTAQLPSSMIDAEISAQGVCASHFNSKRQLTGIRLMTPTRDLLRIEKRQIALGAIVPRRIQELGRYSPDEQPGHRQRVQATVTFSGPYSPLYVVDQTGTLRVDPASCVKVRAGDLVDIAGFPKQGTFGPVMTNAELYVIRHGSPVQPVRVSAEQALEDRDEGQFLQIDATLMDRVAAQSGEVLLLRSGRTLFHARLLQDRAPAASKGSILRLNGICILEANQGQATIPVEFSLLIPSRGDIVLLRSAPWWNAKAFLWVLFAAGGLTLLVSAWAIVLRLQVNRQTKVIRDQLTEAQVLKHAAEVAAQAKGQFLTNMSHEVRTPLNGILGMTELALSEELSPVVRDYLDTARTSGLGLLQVINDVLDLSKMEAGRMVIESAPFDLKTTLDQAIGLFRPAAAEKGLDLDLDYPKEIPQHFLGDSMRIRQIVINLIGNAIKFTAHGSVRVEAEYQAQGIEPAMVRVTVSDTGIGIPLEQQSRLFQSFTQADASTTRKYGGTGLGLAISKQLTGLMGGIIGLNSEPGRGSSFWFEVPLSVAIAPAGETVGNHADVSTFERPEVECAGRTRILLAEDNLVNQKLTSRLMVQAGFEVDIVADGVEVLSRLNEEVYAFVLMDCQMPGMDGYEATKAIRTWEQTEGRNRTPIIALTAHAFPEDRKRCLAAGMDDYLTKPVRPDELRAAAKRWGCVAVGIES